MPIEWGYEIDGRKVTAAEWERWLDDLPQNLATEAIEDTLAKLRCPQHGEAASVRFEGSSGDQWT